MKTIAQKDLFCKGTVKPNRDGGKAGCSKQQHGYSREECSGKVMSDRRRSWRGGQGHAWPERPS